MGRKRRMRKLNRKTQIKSQDDRSGAQAGARTDAISFSQADPSSPSKKRGRYYCPDCGTYHDAAPESNDADTAEIEAAHAAWRKQYSWEELVRRHGEEGAAIIADCL